MESVVHVYLIIIIITFEAKENTLTPISTTFTLIDR